MGSTLMVTMIVGAKSFDLELPANVPMAELVQRLESALYTKGVSSFSHNRVFVKRLNRSLTHRETLGQAGIIDGDILKIAGG